MNRDAIRERGVAIKTGFDLARQAVKARVEGAKELQAHTITDWACTVALLAQIAAPQVAQGNQTILDHTVHLPVVAIDRGRDVTPRPTVTKIRPPPQPTAPATPDSPPRSDPPATPTRIRPPRNAESDAEDGRSSQQDVVDVSRVTKRFEPPSEAKVVLEGEKSRELFPIPIADQVRSFTASGDRVCYIQGNILHVRQGRREQRISIGDVGYVGQITVNSNGEVVVPAMVKGQPKLLLVEANGRVVEYPDPTYRHVNGQPARATQRLDVPSFRTTAGVVGANGRGPSPDDRGIFTLTERDNPRAVRSAYANWQPNPPGTAWQLLYAGDMPYSVGRNPGRNPTSRATAILYTWQMPNDPRISMVLTAYDDSDPDRRLFPGTLFNVETLDGSNFLYDAAMTTANMMRNGSSGKVTTAAVVVSDGQKIKALRTSFSDLLVVREIDMSYLLNPVSAIAIVPERNHESVTYGIAYSKSATEIVVEINSLQTERYERRRQGSIRVPSGTTVTKMSVQEDRNGWYIITYQSILATGEAKVEQVVLTPQNQPGPVVRQTGVNNSGVFYIPEVPR